MGGPVLVLNCAPIGVIHRLGDCSLSRYICSLRCTRGLSTLTMFCSLGVGTRVGLSANVSQLNFSYQDSRLSNLRSTLGSTGFRNVVYRNIFARFTITSQGRTRRSNFASRRFTHFSGTYSGFGRGNFYSMLFRYYGSTNTVGSFSGRLSVTEVNVSLCNLSPSDTLGLASSLVPILAMGSIISVMGRVSTNSAMGCKHAFGTSGAVGVTAMATNCTSKCPQLLSGRNCMCVGNDHTSVMNEVYVSRVYISIASVRNIGVNSRILLFNGSLGISTLTSLYNAVGCRVVYNVSPHIPHIVLGWN